MTNQIVTQGDLELHDVGGELRVHDLDLGRRLGFADPRMVRKLIKSNAGNLNKINVLYAVEQTSGEQGGRPATEYYLDRRQAIFICMKSETATAIDVQMDIVRVYDRHLAGQTAPALPTDYLSALKALVASEEARQTLEAQSRALRQQIETEKPYIELAHALTGPSTLITRRDWCAMMKSEHGAKFGEKALNKWLRDQRYIYDDAIDGTPRAYAAYAHLFKLESELLHGALRPVLKITGQGIRELTPRVLAHFMEVA